MNSAPSFRLTVSMSFWPLYPPSASIFFNLGKQPCMASITECAPTRLMNHDSHREAKCINDNMFLAPFDLLVAVNAPVGGNVVGGFDASGIDDTKAGSIFTSHHLADDDMQCVDLLLKYALQLPFVEVVEDGVVGRKVSREHSPLAPRFDYVHDSIHNVPERVFSFAMLRIQNNFSNLPLFISEVSWILTHNLND